MAQKKEGSADPEEHRCKWLECTIVFPDAESLYDHITSFHIGRKSAGTLSLECHWAGCSSKASKRDHLTSHARVHINLKPHSCSICKKAFKRPQDLKKHEKIHTEEHHQHHRHSKAVTVAGANGAPSTNEHNKPLAPNGAPIGYPQPFPYTGFPYGFPMFPGVGHPNMHGHQLDLAQFVAQQQQLNAQVAAQAGYPITSMSMPPGFPAQFGQNFAPVGAPTTQAQAQAQAAQIQAMQQMLASQTGMFQYGNNPYGYHPSQSVPMPPQQQQQQAVRGSVAPPAAAPAVSTPASLYPSLQPMYNMYGANSNSNLNNGPPLIPTNLPVATSAPTSVKVEDMPSPAGSNHSSQSYSHSHYSQHSQHSSSLSPAGLPALSPPSLSSPENFYSPSPEHDLDARRSYSGNAVAGKKRGFEEAAGQFLGDLRNKRFQDEDSIGNGLDALSNFLLSPELTAPALTPARSQDDSSASSIASDYSQADVNVINDLLLSLGQSVEGTPESNTKDIEAYNPLDASYNLHGHAQPVHTNYGNSLYPSLASMDRAFAPRPSQPPPYAAAEYNTGRHIKSVPAPTISNDHKLPTYTAVGRLSKAAPTSAIREGVNEEMDVDPESRKGYASSLRSTSSDVKEEDESSIKLAPIKSHSQSTSPPTLPSMSTADGPRLPPISSLSSLATLANASVGVTLPPIRDLIDRDSDSMGPISPSMASSSSTSSSSSSSAHTVRPLYPSFSSSPSSSSSLDRRPVSAGGVDRLARRVHKLDMLPTSSIRDDASELLDDTDSSDDENNDHPSLSKKSRVDSPLPLEETDEKAQPPSAETLVKARRMLALKSLIMFVNTAFRNKMTELAAAQKVEDVEEKKVDVAVTA